MNIKLLCLSFLLSAFAIFSFAQIPGELDSSFSSDGKFVASIGAAGGFARSIVLQPEGKMVMACYASNGNDNDFGIMRISPDGSPDNTFGTGGTVVSDLFSNNDYAEGMVVDASGKLVVSGYSFNGNGFDFAAARYLTDGTLDASFGVNGKSIVPLGITSFCRAIKLQADGKIVLGGYTLNSASGTNEFVLVRLLTNGTLDNTFNGSGKVLVGIGTDAATATCIAIQPDGKIVLAGQAFNGAALRWEIAVTRFNTDGSLDDSFGQDGKVITSTGIVSDFINTVALQPDGKIIVAGYSGTAPSDNNFTLARYHADGTVDSSFGSAGLVVNNFGAENNQVNDMVIQPDGSIIVAGSTLIGTVDNFAIARLTIDGALDNSFGNGGIVLTQVGLNDGIQSIALQADGKLVVAGTAFTGSGFDVAAARYETGLSIGIDESINSVSEISVYPCPAKDHVLLSYSLTEDSHISIRLYDMSARFVSELSGPKKKSRGQHEEVIYFPTGLEAGCYFITLRCSDEQRAIKIVLRE